MKEFVTHIKEINRFQPFLPPPFNTSLKQEELFAIIKKSIPSFERLFQTNNGRTTVTNLNQLEAYYMDLKELNPPSNNQPHGRKNNCQNNVLSSHHHGHMSNNNQNIHQKSSNNQNGNNKSCHFHKSTTNNWVECSKNNANSAQQKGIYQVNPSDHSKNNNKTNTNNNNNQNNNNNYCFNNNQCQNHNKEKNPITLPVTRIHTRINLPLKVNTI